MPEIARHQSTINHTSSKGTSEPCPRTRRLAPPQLSRLFRPCFTIQHQETQKTSKTKTLPFAHAPPMGAAFFLSAPWAALPLFFNRETKRPKPRNVPKLQTLHPSQKTKTAPQAPTERLQRRVAWIRINPRTRREPQNDRRREPCFQCPDHPEPDPAGAFLPDRDTRPFARAPQHNGSATGVPGSPAGSALLCDPGQE